MKPATVREALDQLRLDALAHGKVPLAIDYAASITRIDDEAKRKSREPKKRDIRGPGERA